MGWQKCSGIKRSYLEKQPADLSALRFFLCGGTTIPKKVARECQQRWH
ncbi:short chain acyl-CoA synthetase [Shigella sonnei]|nr:short chain acyl-CoA synthetase [Shigella sonnei]SJJ97062.1 short chain acyl-CoA synthetase [Shigella sonnei]SJK23479.1 short chain acyl-CoA synthetase [Shigella sonnei]